MATPIEDLLVTMNERQLLDFEYYLQASQDFLTGMEIGITQLEKIFGNWVANYNKAMYTGIVDSLPEEALLLGVTAYSAELFLKQINSLPKIKDIVKTRGTINKNRLTIVQEIKRREDK